MAVSDEPVRISGAEAEHIDWTRTDGGLKPVPGLRISTVFRADKERPERSDGLGWTYHHHPDIARWKGRLYVGWNSCERDEDTWPSRELYSTSTDGERWTAPVELFPQGISTPLRMYFFHAPNQRMLVIAGMRVSHERTREETKGPLVVREIGADHTLGPVYALSIPDRSVKSELPLFETSPDKGFRDACRSLLADRMYLQQQDYGKLLPPDQRMRWLNDEKLTGEGFGKAMCFFQRADSTFVAVAKKCWVTTSRDGGRTWSLPVQPFTLITGMGKVWGQRMPDGRFMLAYNPHFTLRYPLVVVTGTDGINFGDMRVAHGLLPALRYPGRAKSPGSSYVRGLSLWSDDGSRPTDTDIWLVYSVNKEEICVSRLPGTRSR